jgi:transcriptional regulator with XRE-family HTH domain
VNTQEKKLNIGDRLKELRLSLNMKQADFAALINVSKTGMSEYEANKRIPHKNTLRRICTMFYVSYEWLMTGEGHMKEEGIELAATGTEGRPHLRVVKTTTECRAEIIDTALIKQEQVQDPCDKSMLAIAKQLNRPITVEYNSDGDRWVCTFYPDGNRSEPEPKTINAVFAQKLGLTLPEVETLMRIGHEKGGSEFFKILVKAAEGDKDAKLEMIRRLTE